jgi:hypothetical protein
LRVGSDEINAHRISVVNPLLTVTSSKAEEFGVRYNWSLGDMRGHECDLTDTGT